MSSASDEVEHGLAVVAAPDPVFVLDRDDVDAVRQGPGRLDVVGGLVAADAVMDFHRVGDAALGRDDGDDLAAARRSREVVREGGDAAATRRIGGDEGSSNDDGSPLDRVGAARDRGRSGVARGEPGPGPVAAGGSPEGGPPGSGQAGRTLAARAPLGLCSMSNVTCSPPARRSKSMRGIEGAAMEEVLLLILGGDEAEAAIGDDAFDGSGGHVDLQHFPNREGRSHGPFEKGIDHAEHRHAVRRVPTIARVFDAAS